MPLIKRLSNWKVCLLFTGLFLLYLFFLLPNESAKSDRIYGDLEMPDTKMIYTSEYLRDLVSQMSDEGRAAYITSKIRFDILWPLAYGLWLTSLLGILLKVKSENKSKQIKWTSRLVYLPMLAVLFDFMENVVISIIMSSHPEELSVLFSLAPVLTALKWLLLNGAFLLVIILGGIWLVQMVLKRVKS
ncbi:MAG: hypothetical protein LCH34_11290 [Firmicutes bacterium]|nr:hypothetical protein [Bacillota bacterium]